MFAQERMTRKSIVASSRVALEQKMLEKSLKAGRWYHFDIIEQFYDKRKEKYQWIAWFYEHIDDVMREEIAK